MTHAERTQAAIRGRVAELQKAQTDRAYTIEEKLKDFEPRMRIRSVSEYVALSQHQRRLLGIPDKVEHSVDIIDHSERIVEMEKKARARLDKIKAKEQAHKEKVEKKGCK